MKESHPTAEDVELDAAANLQARFTLLTALERIEMTCDHDSVLSEVS